MNFINLLGLLNDRGQLSLTSLSIYVAYMVLAYGMYTGMTTEQLTVILTIFANYAAKRVTTSKESMQQKQLDQTQQQTINDIDAKHTAAAVDTSKQIAELTTAIDLLKTQIAFRK